MKFVHFTGPEGDTVPINPENVSDIRDASRVPGTNPAAKSVIFFVNGNWQAVQESVSEVEDKLQCK